jgi:hypothetical protein
MPGEAIEGNYGFVRVACSSPDLAVADCIGNAEMFV